MAAVHYWKQEDGSYEIDYFYVTIDDFVSCKTEQRRDFSFWIGIEGEEY